MILKKETGYFVQRNYFEKNILLIFYIFKKFNLWFEKLLQIYSKLWNEDNRNDGYDS